MDNAVLRLDEISANGGRINHTMPNGQRVSLTLTPSDVHDASELPNYLAGYRPFPARADEASPVILVDRLSDKYRTFDAMDAFRPVTPETSDTAPPALVDPSSSLSTYTLKNKYLGSFVPKHIESNADNFSPLMASARRIKRALEIDREIEVWTLLGTNTNWAAGQRTAAGTAWDVAGGNPILDLETAILKSLQPVTDIWMNQETAFAMLRNDYVRDHMRQFFGDSDVRGIGMQIADARKSSTDFMIPGFPPIHVVTGRYYNDATSAYVNHLDTVVALTTRPEGTPTDGEDIASSYTFRLNNEASTGYSVRQFFVDGLGPYGGEMVVVSVSEQCYMTGNTVGGIITNAHS